LILRMAVIALLGAIGASRPPVKPDCGVTARTVITESGIGALRIGLPVDSVRLLCRVTRDTVITNEEDQVDEQVLSVDLGPGTVGAAIKEGRVHRIDVWSPALTTADSLHAGMPVRDLAKHSSVRAMEGESQVFASDSAHCGLLFALTGGGPSAGEFAVTNAELRQWPVTSVIAFIEVHGCRKGGS
jgi:hypothetical protein